MYLHAEQKRKHTQSSKMAQILGPPIKQEGMWR